MRRAVRCNNSIWFGRPSVDMKIGWGGEICAICVELKWVNGVTWSIPSMCNPWALCSNRKEQLSKTFSPHRNRNEKISPLDCTTHLLRQMLEMRLMMWRRCYLRVRLHEVMSIQIASLSKGLRVDVVHLTLGRQMGSGWSWKMEVCGLVNLIRATARRPFVILTNWNVRRRVGPNLLVTER